MNSFVKRLPVNRRGYDWVFPDQHGNLDRFHAALDFVNFNPKFDRVIIVGDLVNRGEHSEEMLDELSKPNRYSVLGNHEWLCIEYQAGAISAERLLHHGGAWFISLPADQRRQIVKYILTKMPFAIEIATRHKTPHKKVGVVHADVIDDDWDKTLEFLDQHGPITHDHTHFCWAHYRVKQQLIRPVAGADHVIVGHTRIAQPLRLANVIAIETAGWRDGRFAHGPTSTMSMYNVHEDQIVQMDFTNVGVPSLRYGT